MQKSLRMFIISSFNKQKTASIEHLLQPQNKHNSNDWHKTAESCSAWSNTRQFTDATSCCTRTSFQFNCQTLH